VETPEAYLEKAISVALDRRLRETLRQTLRQDVSKSSLLAHASQAAKFESAVRQGWRNWCSQQR
jgi:predicted O-linked N-acetylglucosamine transferase (SPINDLY family)